MGRTARLRGIDRTRDDCVACCSASPRTQANPITELQVQAEEQQRRTTSARRLAASCAGPGRVFLMLSRCLASCSSSFRIFSSSLQAARRRFRPLPDRRNAADFLTVDAQTPRSRVSPDVELVHRFIHGRRGGRWLLGTE